MIQAKGIKEYLNCDISNYYDEYLQYGRFSPIQDLGKNKQYFANVSKRLV